MERFGKFIAKNRVLVLIVATILLVPAFYEMASTKINYDLLSYLPEDLDTTRGQKIMEESFGRKSTAFLVIEDMPSKDVKKIKEKIIDIEGVEEVTWIDDILDTRIPKGMLPSKIRDVFYSENSTLLLIKFEDQSSSPITQDAITSIRGVLDRQCFLSGAAAIAKDTKALSDKETPRYILLAVVLAVIVLMLTMESTFIPVVFLISIGYAIVYNLGTNQFLDGMSYVTKALAAVLQLGVTMDYSIFLMHRYEEELESGLDKESAMAKAIANTFTSVTGSSLTTIAGFLAICAMQLTLGIDIGLVMAKGVAFGVLSTLTILPAFILVFDKLIHRFSHRTLLPSFEKTSSFVTRHYKTFVIIFILAFLPAIFGAKNTEVYYNLDESLPRDLESIIATRKLKEDFDMNSTDFIIVSDDIPSYQLREMADEIAKVEGVNEVLSYDSFIGQRIPESFIPEEVREIFKSDGYNMMIASSEYKPARDEANAQIEKIQSIVKRYDQDGIVAGEAPLTKDLIEITEQDMKRVNYLSIAAIFIIIAIVFKSISIPIILVMSIQLAILVNMGLPYYMGSSIPFIASIVVGTIQLGATVDYAILMATRFREELGNGHDKYTAMKITVRESAKSIVASAMTFFAATAGVAIISHMDVVKTLCMLIARGAIISMIVIICILPSLLIVFEGFIARTSKGWVSQRTERQSKRHEHIVAQ